MNSPTDDPRLKEPATWHRVGFWVLAALFAVMVIGSLLLGGTDEQRSDDSKNVAAQVEAEEPEPPPKPRPFRATETQVSALFGEVLGEESGGEPRIKMISCVNDECAVNYRSKEIVFGQDEVLRDQRPIWKKLFSYKRFKRAKLIPHTTVVSAGGQERNGAILRVTCDRSDHRQIDWDNVDADGIKAICDYVEFVGFD